MKIILLLFIGSLPLASGAQNYRIEVGLKASVLIIKKGSGPDLNLASTFGLPDYLPFPTGEIYYFVRPKIGIGLFYANSLNSRFGHSEGDYYQVRDGQYDEAHGSAVYQHYGVDVQFSTNREKRFRIYAILGILKAEQVIDFGPFKAASSGTGYSGGVGVIIKVTRSIALNLFDARYIQYQKEFGYTSAEENPWGVKIDSGIIFKMFRKK